jgi:hypothetical protein
MDLEISGCHEGEEEELGVVAIPGEPIRFEWEHRWLKGHEYAFMLENVDVYC